MLMFGKISVGVRTAASAPKIAIRNDKTTKVYGRRRAICTTHTCAFSRRKRQIRRRVESGAAPPIVNLHELKCRAEPALLPHLGTGEVRHHSLFAQVGGAWVRRRQFDK